MTKKQFLISDPHFGHKNIITFKKWIWFKDKRYRNVCVEQINYTPIELEEILSGYY